MGVPQQYAQEVEAQQYLVPNQQFDLYCFSILMVSYLIARARLAKRL